MLRIKPKIKILALCISGVLTGNCVTSYAESLLEVYQQAVAYDSQFKQAQADWFAAQQNIPIARASLLPNIAIQAGAAYNNQDFTQDAAFAANGVYSSTSFNLTLNQPILNWGLWKTLEGAEANVKAATANYYFSQQDLISRTVKAYLNVLQANDILRFTRAKKRAFAEEYDTAKQKFDVGLVPITDVYDAQAKYDQSKAQEIADINQLADSLESLRIITGHYYIYLNGLTSEGIPLINPAPNDIEAWSATAARQSYQIKAQHFTAEAAKANIGVQAAGFLPSFGIQGSISDQRQYDRDLLFAFPPKNEDLVQDLSTLGVGMNFNVLSGGSVVAQTQQARYQYASASAKEETVYQQVVAATRQAFLGVNSNNAQVKADVLSIKSSQSALSSARAGYQVGTRTLLDVLDDTTQLYQNQQAHALDQYSYINNFVSLKQSAGTLSSADVVKLSSWLTKPINLEAAQRFSGASDIKEPRQPTTTQSFETALDSASPAPTSRPAAPVRTMTTPPPSIQTVPTQPKTSLQPNISTPAAPPSNYGIPTTGPATTPITAPITGPVSN